MVDDELQLAALPLQRVCLLDFNHDACYAAIENLTRSASEGIVPSRTVKESLFHGGLGKGGGCMTQITGCRRSIAFHHVWKSGGTSVLHALSTLSPTGRIMLDRCWKDESVCPRIRGRRGPDAPFYFTFVRHPVEHFVSGYVEMEHRSSIKEEEGDNSYGMHHYGFSPRLVKQSRGSRGRALEFVCQYICGTLHAAGHTRLQASAFFACPRQGGGPSFDFIGKLEVADADWMRVGVSAKCPALANSTLPSSISSHPNTSASSSDQTTQRVRQAMWQALGDWRLRVALEKLLAADFLLFNYSFGAPLIGAGHGAASSVPSDLGTRAARVGAARNVGGDLATSAGCDWTCDST